jgi:hypothetical protein
VSGGIYTQCTDVDTDAERAAEAQSVWPAFLREPVWKGRLAVRKALKEDCQRLRERWAVDEAPLGAKLAKVPACDRCVLLSRSSVRMHVRSTARSRRAALLTLANSALHARIGELKVDDAFKASAARACSASEASRAAPSV